MSLTDHEYTNVRRSTGEIGPGKFRSEREDWRALSPDEQVQVAMVHDGLAHPALCGVRVREYLRRHGAA